MLKQSNRIIVFFAVIAFSVSPFLVGCASRPSQEELRQLNDLKAEVASLERQISDKEREKADLERQIADKKAQLQECQSEKDAVKKALGQ